MSKSILTDDMKRVVSEQRLGYVATVCPDGTPNLSPKGTTAVWDDSRLIFADLRSPRTIRNLMANPSVEVNVVDPIRRKGYRFKGTAAVLSEGDDFEEGVAFFEKQKSVARARERIRAVVLITVEHTEPLTSPAYDLGTTESEIVSTWLATYLPLYSVPVPSSGATRMSASLTPDQM